MDLKKVAEDWIGAKLEDLKSEEVRHIISQLGEKDK